MAWKSLKTDWILQTCFPLECEFFVSVLLSLLGWLKKPASASAPATPIKKFPDRVTFQTRKCITSLGFFAIPTLRCRLGFPRRKAFLSTAIATPCKVCTSSCLLRTRSCTSFIFAQAFQRQITHHVITLEIMSRQKMEYWSQMGAADLRKEMHFSAFAASPPLAVCTRPSCFRQGPSESSLCGLREKLLPSQLHGIGTVCKA